MVIVLSIYALLIWLLFFKLKVLPWNRSTQILVSVIGLVIVLVVIGLLNTKTPSGRVTVTTRVVQIAPVVGGVVASVPVTANEPVTQGTVLFELDQTPYQAALDEALADLTIAQITLDRKQTVFDRNSNTISEQELDESRAAVGAAMARKDAAQYELDQTVVRAPADGFVTSVGVSAGDQARPLSPVMPFIASEGAFIAGVFRQNGMDGMPPGTPVRIVLDRKPGQIFESEVLQVAPASSSGQISAGSDLLGGLDIGSSGESLVILAWPENLDRAVATPGTVGSATAIGPDAGAMGMLATILLYLKLLGTYL
jgi:multidrug resistance efflux pump